MEDWTEAFFKGPWQIHQIEGYPAERTSREVAFILETLRPEPGARMLDVPCGTGRHSIELSSRGFRMTALDFNATALDASRSQAEKLGVEVDFREGDMRALTFREEFDAAFCYFGSFGFFSKVGSRRATVVATK